MNILWMIGKGCICKEMLSTFTKIPATVRQDPPYLQELEANEPWIPPVFFGHKSQVVFNMNGAI